MMEMIAKGMDANALERQADNTGRVDDAANFLTQDTNNLKREVNI